MHRDSSHSDTNRIIDCLKQFREICFVFRIYFTMGDSLSVQNSLPCLFSHRHGNVICVLQHLMKQRLDYLFLTEPFHNRLSHKNQQDHYQPEPLRVEVETTYFLVCIFTIIMVVTVVLNVQKSSFRS